MVKTPVGDAVFPGSRRRRKIEIRFTMATMKATKRTERGTRQSRRLRKEGNIPGIIYGHGEEPVAVTLGRHDIELAILHGERLLEVKIARKTHNVLIKDVQYDAFGSEILHVDLNRVDLDERVEITVPIILVGTPEGIKDGGVLQQAESELQLKCPVRHIPEEIKYLVTEMKLNDRLYMKDLVLSEGATLLNNPETLVCSVTEIQEAAEEAPLEGAGAPEPEVIGEKPSEDQETPAE